MQKYAATRDAGQAFARNTRLKPAQVEYLQDSAAAQPAGNGSGNDGAIPGMPGG